MEDNYSLIELYLLGKLNPTEKKNFEERLQREPELARAFRLQQLEHDALDLMLERDLRQKMSQWDSETPDLQSPRQRSYGGLVAGIALLVLLVAAIYWLTLPVAPAPVPAPTDAPAGSPTPPKEVPMAHTDTPAANPTKTVRPTRSPDDQRLLALAENNYRDDMIRAQLRGNSPGLDSLNLWYNQRQYPKVVAATNIIASSEANYWRQLELRAHAFFQLKKYKDAALVFEQVANSNKEPFAERSDWFLLLALAAQGNAAQTRLLEQYQKIMATPDHTFYREAARLNLK